MLVYRFHPGYAALRNPDDAGTILTHYAAKLLTLS
jgi:hypothetical protein